MPQNNPDIVNSQGFKEFVKETNLEVFNLESFQLVLFNIGRWTMEIDQKNQENESRIQQLEERLLEVGNNIPISHNSDIINRGPSLAGTMNIKELKSYIKDLPDDMEVGVEGASYLVAGLEKAHVEGDLFVLHLAFGNTVKNYNYLT